MLASLAKDPADAALLEELLCLLKQAPFDMVEGLAHREVVERPVSWTRGHLRSSQRQHPSSRDHDARVVSRTRMIGIWKRWRGPARRKKQLQRLAENDGD